MADQPVGIWLPTATVRCPTHNSMLVPGQYRQPGGQIVGVLVCWFCVHGSEPGAPRPDCPGCGELMRASLRTERGRPMPRAVWACFNCGKHEEPPYRQVLRGERLSERLRRAG